MKKSTAGKYCSSSSVGGRRHANAGRRPGSYEKEEKMRRTELSSLVKFWQPDGRGTQQVDASGMAANERLHGGARVVRRGHRVGRRRYDGRQAEFGVTHARLRRCVIRASLVLLDECERLLGKGQSAAACVLCSALMVSLLRGKIVPFQGEVLAVNCLPFAFASSSLHRRQASRRWPLMTERLTACVLRYYRPDLLPRFAAPPSRVLRVAPIFSTLIIQPLQAAISIRSSHTRLCKLPESGNKSN